MIKHEVKKFFISFIFTNICLIYFSSGLFQHSILEAIKNTFSYNDYTTILLALFFYAIGYSIFSLIYLLIKYIIKKKKLSPLKTTVIIISVIFIMFFVNDQLIINDIKEYQTIGYFALKDTSNGEIDSTNFYEYEWIKESIEFYDGEYLEKEKVVFTPDNSFRLNGTRIKVDRLYLFRKHLNYIDNYDVNGKYIYENAIFIVDSLNNTYSIQIRKNRLYLNSIVNPL